MFEEQFSNGFLFHLLTAIKITFVKAKIFNYFQMYFIIKITKTITRNYTVVEKKVFVFKSIIECSRYFNSKLFSLDIINLKCNYSKYVCTNILK